MFTPSSGSMTRRSLPASVSRSGGRESDRSNALSGSTTGASSQVRRASRDRLIPARMRWRCCGDPIACILHYDVRVNQVSRRSKESLMPTLTDAGAAVAIREHHVELQAALRERVAALRHVVQAGPPHEPAQRAVLAFLDTELLPHAAAEERSIYPAGDRGLTALLVKAMLEEHRNLIAQVASLRKSTDAIEAVGIASAILALFESHLSKENDLLLPALVADPGVSLGALLGGMHEILG